MCIHWGLVIYYLRGGRGELFWESLEDFQNNLQFIIATLDKIALEGNAPAPGSSVLLSSKERLISERFVGSNFKLGEGLTLLKATDLERVLLHKRVRIEEKMFSSSFVRDCSFLKVTLLWLLHSISIDAGYCFVLLLWLKYCPYETLKCCFLQIKIKSKLLPISGIIVIIIKMTPM